MAFTCAPGEWPEGRALLSWDEFMAALPEFSDDAGELEFREVLNSLSRQVEADTLRRAEDDILCGLPALITVAGDAAHLSLSDSGSDSDDDEDDEDDEEEAEAGYDDDDGVDRSVFPHTKGRLFIVQPRQLPQGQQHGRWPYDDVLRALRDANFVTSGFTRNQVVRPFDKGVHAAATITLTYGDGTYKPTSRWRPLVYAIKVPLDERLKILAQFEKMIKAKRFVKSQQPCRNQYDTFAQVSALKGDAEFGDVLMYTVLMLPIQQALLATRIVKLARGGFAFTKVASMSKAAHAAQEHYDGQSPHSHPRPSSRVRVRIIIALSETSSSAHPLRTPGFRPSCPAAARRPQAS